MKRFTILCILLLGSMALHAQVGLKISGKLRILKPLEIHLETIDGQQLLSAKVSKDGTFSMGPREITPDLYILCMGETRQPVYLTNNQVIIKGFYDATSPENSSLAFTGIDDFLKISAWIPKGKNAVPKIIGSEVKGQLEGTMYSALAYLAATDDYETNKMLLELVPESVKDALSVKWLACKVDSLSRFAIGAEAYDFTYVNPDGKPVRLSDFRGKFVLIDFWASWCGPCRQEMKSLLPIYNELKDDDLVFISISLDKREKDWRNMLEVENLPWVMLWNKEGFTVGDAPNTIQKAYGFYGIPFIVLIDKKGRILARGLRGEKEREEILKARMNVE